MKTALKNNEGWWIQLPKQCLLSLQIETILARFGSGQVGPIVILISQQSRGLGWDWEKKTSSLVANNRTK